MTDATPKLTREDLERDLSDVMQYSAEMISKLSMRDFATNWAPRFFNTEPAVQTQALEEWERLIAFGRNKPVFLFDEDRTIKWVFPPILGDFQPRYTGEHNSLFSIGMEIKTVMNRMRKQGEAMSEKIYSSLALETADKEMWQRHLHEIRMHCGYPYPGQTTITTGKGNTAPVTPSSLSQPDDYDF